MTKKREPVDKPRERMIRLLQMDARIKAFNKKCADEEHTDTGDAGDLLYWLQRNVRELRKING